MKHNISDDILLHAYNLKVFEPVLCEGLSNGKVVEFIETYCLDDLTKKIMTEYYAEDRSKSSIASEWGLGTKEVETHLLTGTWQILGGRYKDECLDRQPKIEDSVKTLWLKKHIIDMLISAGYYTIKQVVEAPYYMLNNIRDMSNKRMKDIMVACLAFGFAPIAYADYKRGSKVRRVPKNREECNITLGRLVGASQADIDKLVDYHENKRNRRDKI